MLVVTNVSNSNLTKIKIKILWDMTPYSFVDTNLLLHFQGRGLGSPPKPAVYLPSYGNGRNFPTNTREAADLTPETNFCSEYLTSLMLTN
jgi:hypothetical protein